VSTTLARPASSKPKDCQLPISYGYGSHAIKTRSGAELFTDVDLGTRDDYSVEVEGISSITSATIDPSVSPTFPNRVLGIADIIKESAASAGMLSLEDNWDGEGSPAYSVGTFIRATLYLLQSAIGFRLTYGMAMPTPKIRKGPEGSIDLHWRTLTRELLINIPTDSGELADYYGDDGADGNPVRGSLDLNTPDYRLMLWLTS